MGEESNRHAVLLPVKPHYADAIMTGSKKVEFRKVRFQESVSYVVVYASKPVCKILGYFNIVDIDEGSPRSLGNKYKSVGGITRNELMAYYSKTNTGYAINIGQIVQFERPLPLNSVRRISSVPQSFCYLSESEFLKLLMVSNNTNKKRSSRKS